MAIAKKCDRCSRLYEQYNIKNDSKNINGIMTLNIDSGQRYFKHGPLDLCPECSKKLINWLKCWSDINGEEDRSE